MITMIFFVFYDKAFLQWASSKGSEVSDVHRLRRIRLK